jgi:hypothetical protein
LCYGQKHTPIFFGACFSFKKDETEQQKMMDSGLIGKIEKAKRYAEEKDRISITKFEAKFRGENNEHFVTYDDGNWNCTCNYFQGHGVCAHTMGIELVLEGMVEPSNQLI